MFITNPWTFSSFSSFVLKLKQIGFDSRKVWWIAHIGAWDPWMLWIARDISLSMMIWISAQVPHIISIFIICLEMIVIIRSSQLRPVSQRKWLGLDFLNVIWSFFRFVWRRWHDHYRRHVARCRYGWVIFIETTSSLFATLGVTSRIEGSCIWVRIIVWCPVCIMLMAPCRD